ncbi:MAG: pilus assembly PilX N-terminal domain-containing protein [Phycisphaerae bacterium]|nr:pilus assembly PilX N-terminal domain-containing protein [Phycisphaerae bacterium]
MKTKIYNSGFSSIMAMFFILLFSALAISFAHMSSLNVKMSENHSHLTKAQAAAESGLNYAIYLVNNYDPPSDVYTYYNVVSENEALTSFGYFKDHVVSQMSGSPLMSGLSISYSSSSNTIKLPSAGAIKLDSASEGFSLVFQFQAGDSVTPHKMSVTSLGVAGDSTKAITMEFSIAKDADVLNYAIASRGRIWLTGDSTIDGDVYTDWDNPACAPFNMTSDSKINGTINTVFTKEQADDASWQLETLDEDGNAIFDDDGNRVYSSIDEVQGHHEGINYGVESNVPGMNINDYNTDMYRQGLPDIPSASYTSVEYFPHAAGNYNAPKYSSSLKLYRHVYDGVHFKDVRLPDNRNALFKNCTFEGVLYVDCYKSTSSYYNNVRFDDCTFNGVIVTDVPSVLKWQYNCLYFTGDAVFNNQAMEEATILAPNFNVNLGNANAATGTNNQLTGAVIGGIVDVRGNAQIDGTIISMTDTTQWTSGYVTNIGVTLSDGGSETTEIGDIGIINIRPDQEKMLPSGIKTPIVIKKNSGTYLEL